MVGFVIAEPIVLHVFETEVHAQAVADKEEAYADGTSELTAKYRDIPRLEARRDELVADLATIDTGEALGSSKAYQLLSENVSRLETRAARAGAQGRGAVARGLRHRAQAQRGQLKRLEAQLLSNEATATRVEQRQQRAELAQVQKELTRQKAERARATARLKREYRRPPGLLDRIEALSTLTRENASMRLWRLMLLAFILCLDSLPADREVYVPRRAKLYERVQDGLEAADASRSSSTPQRTSKRARSRQV